MMEHEDRRMKFPEGIFPFHEGRMLEFRALKAMVTGDDEQAVRISCLHLLNKVINGSVGVPEGPHYFGNDGFL